MADRNWLELIEEQKQSGKTIAEFCSQKSIHYTSFYKNRKKLQKSSFIEIKQKVPVLTKQEVPLILRYKDFSLDLNRGYDRKALTDLLNILRAL